MKSRTLVAVQMAFRLEDYRSAESFHKRVESLVKSIRQRYPNDELLVVFPEDVGLGLVFTQDYELVHKCSTMVEAGLRMMERHHARLKPSEGGEVSFPAMVRRLLLLVGGFVERVYHETFSELARRYQVWLVAGSAPIPEGDCVRNICYTYNPKGERVLVQRKINLVPLEQEAGLNLCSSPPKVATVSTPFGKLGVLVCLDGFYHELLDQLVKQGAEVVAQPSFNPLPWDQEQAQGWEAGLLAGVQKHPRLVGVNPMGVGQLFDVAAEGRSSIVAHRSQTLDGSGYLARAKSKDSEELVVYTLKQEKP